MFADKYPSIFSRQMEAIVYIIDMYMKDLTRSATEKFDVQHHEMLT